MSATQQKQIATWVKGMVPGGGTWTLCYQMSRDGQRPQTFHSNCNSHSKTVTVMYNNYYKLIGGTNVGTWASTYGGTSTVGNSPYQMLFSLTANQTIRRSTTSYNSVNGCPSSSYGPNVSVPPPACVPQLVSVHLQRTL